LYAYDLTPTTSLEVELSSIEDGEFGHGGDGDVGDSDLRSEDVLLRLREWQDRNHHEISSVKDGDENESEGGIRKVHDNEGVKYAVDSIGDGARTRPTNLEDEMGRLELVNDTSGDPTMTDEPCTTTTNTNTQNTAASSSPSAYPPNIPNSNETDHVWCQEQIAAFAEKCTSLRNENYRLRTQRDRMRVLLDDVMAGYRAEIFASRRKTDFLGEVLDRMRVFGDISEEERAGVVAVERGDEDENEDDEENGTWDGDKGEDIGVHGAWHGDRSDIVD
jgi:hypothetical protein